MGLFDKLKGVFFEEEEVEVPEEKVARKIKNPDVVEKKEVLVDFEEEKVESDKVEEETIEIKKEQFTVPFDDSDFEVEKTIEFEEPIKEEIIREVKEEPIKLYGEVVNKEYEEVKKEPVKDERYRGLYEAGVEERRLGFSPSPIISPIFGILNKNYSKDEIVHKSEVRLSQTSSKKADLDSVREKVLKDTDEISEKIKEEPSFYDLSEDSPTIKEITLGDAEEYFTDLGLEYNVDYKVEEDKKDEIKEVEYKSRREKNRELGGDTDQHLFDLIDSIYEGKE